MFRLQYNGVPFVAEKAIRASGNDVSEAIAIGNTRDSLSSMSHIYFRSILRQARKRCDDTRRLTNYFRCGRAVWSRVARTARTDNQLRIRLRNGVVPTTMFTKAERQEEPWRSDDNLVYRFLLSSSVLNRKEHAKDQWQFVECISRAD